jgi:hypothetical protein
MNFKQTLLARKKLLSLGASVAMAFAATSANALTFIGPQEFHGTGLGAVNTILTIQNTGTESGSVGLNSSGEQVITGDAKTGASQTQLLSLAEIGATSAAELQIVFNAVEPDNAENSISLDNLVLSIFDPSGTVLFTSDAFSPITFDDTFNGTGQSGFVFGLSDAEASAAQSAFSGDFGANLVGLSATASMSAAGHESFFVTTNTAPIPEPSTYAMMGVGLLGLALARRRKTKQ